MWLMRAVRLNQNKLLVLKPKHWAERRWKHCADMRGTADSVCNSLCRSFCCAWIDLCFIVLQWKNCSWPSCSCPQNSLWKLSRQIEVILKRLVMIITQHTVLWKPLQAQVQVNMSWQKSEKWPVKFWGTAFTKQSIKDLVVSFAVLFMYQLNQKF